MEYQYEFENDPVYCYTGSSILKNKLNIHDAESFHEAEREITSMRIAQALLNPIQESLTQLT